jgi:antirestriction protein ArdC|tara:strand:- start:1689 stop:2570 length:882 start_codon:yes stop_codon:yes gene_type:complete
MSKADKIVQIIIKKIEDGIDNKWQMPWHNRDFRFPINTDGYEYQGLNCFWLWMVKDMRGYTSNQWGTYNQWKQIGGDVGGQSATAYNQYILQPRIGTDDDDNVFIKGFKTWAVFNRDQVKGLPKLQSEQSFVTEEMITDKAIKQQCINWFANIPATIHTGHNKACYVPSKDEIRMPDFDTFRTDIDYYSVLAHEIIHWTGADQRLNRKLSQERQSYAFEELVAELGSALIAANLKIQSKPTDNTTAYLKGWLQAVKKKPKTLWDAMSLAKHAVSFLNDYQRKNIARSLQKKVA